MNDFILSTVRRVLEKNEKDDFGVIELILNYRIQNYVIYFNKIGKLLIGENVLNTLNTLASLNRNRNLLLLKEVMIIDEYLSSNTVPRIWMKGIKDIIKQSEGGINRKLIDCDLLVDNKKFSPIFPDMFSKYSFKFGVYDKEGKFFSYTQEQFDMLNDDSNYEYTGFSKKVFIPNIENKEQFDILPEILKKRFRYFYDNEKQMYFTDFILNVHIDLNTGFGEKTEKKLGKLPLMDELDELWYLVMKSYYEVITGPSNDLQRLFSTIEKIELSNYKFSYVKEYFKENYSEYYREEIFEPFEIIIQNGNFKKIVDNILSK